MTWKRQVSMAREQQTEAANLKEGGVWHLRN